MSRSLKKGPFIDQRLLAKVKKMQSGKKGSIKTWSRACTIVPEMVGFTFAVHNGKDFINVFVSEDLVGHKLGEFSPSRKFVRHGGRIQKELEMAQKQKEIEASKAEKPEKDKK